MMIMKIKLELYCVKFIKHFLKTFSINKNLLLNITRKEKHQNVCQVFKNYFVNLVIGVINLNKKGGGQLCMIMLKMFKQQEGISKWVSISLQEMAMETSLLIIIYSKQGENIF